MGVIARELILARHLLFMLTWRDIRIRYKQSLMGFLWALLMPMLIVSAGLLVRQVMAVLAGGPVRLADIAGVAIKALPWAFFVGSIRFATTSLTSNSNLVAKIYFPREVLPLAAVLVHLFDMAIATPVVLAVLVAAQVGVSVHLLWLPALMLLLIALTVGLALLLACANLFFRDIKYLVEATLTFGIFFTPVFYDVQMLGSWAPLVMLNPLSAILQGMADVVLLHHAPDFPWLAYSAAIATIGFIGSWIVFDRAEAAFAENV